MFFYFSFNIGFAFFQCSQFYTTITYIAITYDGYAVPNTCFNLTSLQTKASLCDKQNHYLAKIPVGYTPLFVDLKGNYLQSELDRENFLSLITASLQKMGVTGQGKVYQL